MRLSEREYEELLANRTASQHLQVITGCKLSPVPAVKPHERGTRHGKRPGPNKTEAEYGRMLGLEYPGARVRYEGVTLHLDNGHAYTPDWCVILLTGEMLMVEVKARGKNGYRQPSYQRAKVMFDQSRIEYPHWQWRWAEKQEGRWHIG
jgi:hypothetical protein